MPSSCPSQAGMMPPLWNQSCTRKPQNSLLESLRLSPHGDRTARESLLLLRFLLLSWLAIKAATLHEESQRLCFLELAEDPARCATSPSRRRCSSAWATLALKAWTKDLLLSELHFDLCLCCCSKPSHGQ